MSNSVGNNTVKEIIHFLSSPLAKPEVKESAQAQAEILRLKQMVEGDFSKFEELIKTSLFPSMDFFGVFYKALQLGEACQEQVWLQSLTSRVRDMSTHFKEEDKTDLIPIFHQYAPC